MCWSMDQLHPQRGITNKKIVVKAYLNVATKEGGEVFVGPWGTYGPKWVTPGIFSGKIFLVGATQESCDTHYGVTME